MRILIYPEVEAFKQLKKQQIYEKQQLEEEAAADNPGIKSGRRRGNVNCEY